MAKKEGEMSCTTCSATYSAVWRKDKELKTRICNRCYLQKYPPKKVDSSDGPEAKKRKLDPPAAPAQEVKKEKKEKEEKKEKKEKADKKENEETKVKKEPGEEVKTESKAEVKEEVKEEVKDELKEEMKEEIKEEVKEDRKEKRRKKNDDNADLFGDILEEVPPDVEVESDTEYPEVDLAKTPVGLVVESSGNSRVDGKYKRLPNPCRGRPAYYGRRADKDGKDKTMYIYFCKKAWMIGAKYGISKNNASLKEVDGVLDPCEPYPHAWRVYDKDADAHNIVLAMRVYSQEAAAEQCKLPEPPLLGSGFSSKSGGSAELSAEELAERKKHKDEKKKAKEEKAREKQAEKEKKATEVAERPEGATEGKAEEGKAEGTSEQAAKKDDEAPSSCSESSSQSSEEESEESASSSDSEGPSASPAKAQAEDQEAVRIHKAQMFEKRLREQLEGLYKKKDQKGLQTQFASIQNKLREKKDSLEAVAGLTQAKVDQLLETLKRDYQIQEKAKARAPKAPPPPHLLKKASAPGPPAPSTPPDNSGASDGFSLPHRTQKPGKSVLRPWYDGPRRKGSQPHISLVSGQAPQIREHYITSFRAEGESLWFAQPGLSVVCDSCERSVPQSMGSLQGAPTQSQFAQNRFICSECSGIGM